MSDEFDLVKWIEKELKVEFNLEFHKQMLKLFGVPTAHEVEYSWMSMSGIFTTLHEPTNTAWGFWERPKSFTPDQFNRIWNGFSEKRKVDYVLSLIT